jgi:hypothetical protein
MRTYDVYHIGEHHATVSVQDDRCSGLQTVWRGFANMRTGQR